MKFPKSMHAEGWDNHFEATDKSVSSAPLHAAKAPAIGSARMKPSGAGAKISANQPLHTDTLRDTPRAAPHIDPVYARAQPTVASVERDRQMSWMIPAGAGAAIIAAVAIWAVNRPSSAPVTPPAMVVGSAEPQVEVAAATPTPAPEASPAAAVEESSTATTVAAPTPVEPAPARLGLPVTTSRLAVEPRPVVAQAPTLAARPDLVTRSAPATPVAVPPTTVAAAPTDTQPLAVPPGSAPIVMPPTAAGPATATATTPQAVTPPVASAPDTAATGTPPLAQAQPAPQVEDSGITVKVRMALAADSTLAAVPIAVSTDHGVVKLEGQVPDSQTRDRATFVASSATGVKAIDNRLTLPPATVVSQAPTLPQ